jgi:hypothetical protein
MSFNIKISAPGLTAIIGGRPKVYVLILFI